VFVEHWEDRASVDAHFAVPASHDFVEAVTAMASEPPTIEIYETTRL
jgi:quinol monooxygenase YgiN